MLNVPGIILSAIIRKLYYKIISGHKGCDILCWLYFVGEFARDIDLPNIFMGVLYQCIVIKIIGDNHWFACYILGLCLIQILFYPAL